MTVFLNGQFLPIEEAKVPVLDRGFIFGDGIYEFVPVYSRTPFRLDGHLARLERSLAEVRIRNPYSRAQWGEIIARLISLQSFEDQGVYWQVTRGVARRDHAFPKDIEPTVFMMANPLVTPTAEQVEKGGSAVSAQDFRWHRCDIKVTSLMGNCMLRQLSAEAGGVETILFRGDQLTEASSSNVFIVKGGRIATPPKTNLILPGITLDAVYDVVARGGLPFEVREITEQEVRAADELWVSSSSKEIFPVVSLDGKAIGDGRPGPVFRKAWQIYQDFKNEVMRGKQEAQSV
ncbi:MAG: D-amino acid aminotransferase [Betaproteobacteria bacterium]|jgi:D-alanine transaminase|nr:D-amino acid aminotransferase [Betaproteobacteria bacterium]